MSLDEREVWENFTNDAAEALQDIEESLLALESDSSSSENLHRLYRGLHSIKGNSGFLQLETIEHLAHVSEDLIGLVRDGGVALDREIVELMLKAIDELRQLIERAGVERRNPVADHSVEFLAETIVEAFTMRGGKREAPKETEFWGVFSDPPTAGAASLASARPALDAEPVEILLSVVRVALPAIGAAVSAVRSGDGDVGAVAQACSRIAAPAERLSFVRVVDAINALVAAAGMGPGPTLDGAELGLYDRLVEVEDHLRVIDSGAEDFGLRGLLSAACAERLFGELAVLEQVAKEGAARKHGVIQATLQHVALACEHYGFATGVQRTLDVEDVLLRAVERGSDLQADEVELCLRLVADVGREAAAARAGAGSDHAGVALAGSSTAVPPDVVASEPLRRAFTRTAAALLESASARGLVPTEVRASLADSPAMESALRSLLRSDEVVTITSAVEGADELFLVASRSTSWLTQALATIDPSGVRLRVEGSTTVIEEPSAALPTRESVPVARPTPVGGPPLAASPARAAERADEDTKEQKTEFLRVDARKISLLMDLASEIGLACGAVTHHPSLEGLELEGYAAASHKLELLVREMQNEVSGMRLVPVSGVFQRMKRVVRDTAKRTGKQVDLVLEGEETEIDKVMVDALQDPLVHVLRNAIDHGIELPEERVAAGKPATGTIVLSASHQGGEVSIEVADDGAGVKRDRVRARAESRGLIAPNAELSDDEILSLVFEPGFSTKETIDELSGRGVGMDVVKTTIAGLRGRTRLKSNEGRGSRLTMTMPLTLAFVEAMVVREADRLFALPIEKVFEVFKVDASKVSRNSADGQLLIRVRDTLVPVLWLHRFWGEGRSASESLEDRVLVVVQTSHGEFALPVDALLGNQQVMLKPLRGPLASIRAAAGCGMLRTGDVALALDCEQLHA